MVLFDSIEDIFQDLRGISDYSRALVTLATAIGSLLVVLYFLKFVFLLYKDLRLYICSQLCLKTNLRERYGQWAVVTGATDGIGLAMARRLARRGMSIIVIGRNEEKLMRTKILLAEEPNAGEILTVKIDLSDSSIENYERIRGLIDPDNRDIGILINNAGLFSSKYARFYHFDMEFLREIVNVNILAAVYLTRMVLPGMVEREKGLILNVSSILGCIPSPNMGLYGQTKAFMNSFSENLQAEFASHPIDIINLTPGAVSTKLFLNNANITKTSPIIPTPDDYASTCLNAVSTRYKTFCGVYFHEVVLRGSQFFDYFGLVPFSMRIVQRLFGKDTKLSPVMKRKRVVQVEN